MSENYRELCNDELSKLSELGIAEAQVEYGYRLLNGLSMDRSDIEEAIKWFKLSSSQGNAYALFYLGTMYKIGVGLEKDLKKAFLLYSESAEKGLSIAQYYLGDMYQYGVGTTVNEELAIKWITESQSLKEQNNFINV